MKVLAFDLNTVCTGVFGAVIDDDHDEISMVTSASIHVRDFKVSDHFPYKNSKQKIWTNKTGTNEHSAYIIPGETHVSVTEKKKRDSAVRNARNRHQIDRMSQEFGKLLRAVKPDLVLIERNEMFRGIMTIEVLAKLTGTLIGECNGLGIHYETYNVNVVRKPYNVAKLSMEYARGRSESSVASEEDLAKAAIRFYLEQRYAAYGVSLDTLDESDAALVFDYWFNHVHKKSA